MKQNDPSHALLADAQELGHEARAGSGDHAALKLWLRMLACTTQIEAEIRRRLRERFDISLARFDYMAQLYRYRDGLKMRELSRYLMVTGGNVTGLTDDLAHDGMVMRESSPSDRRAWIVRLTPKGRRQFETMAREHEGWILELFAGLDARRCSSCTAARPAARASGAQRTGQRGNVMLGEARCGMRWSRSSSTRQQAQRCGWSARLPLYRASAEVRAVGRLRFTAAVAAKRRLPCAARPAVALRNSLRSLRSLRSDSRNESDDEARAAHAPTTGLRCSAPQRRCAGRPPAPLRRTALDSRQEKHCVRAKSWTTFAVRPRSGSPHRTAGSAQSRGRVAGGAPLRRRAAQPCGRRARSARFVI